MSANGHAVALERLRERFLQTTDLVMMDGAHVSPEEMWEYANLPLRGGYSDILDHKLDLDLCSVVRHKYLMFSAKDRTVKMRAQGAPAVLFGDLILRFPAKEIAYGCHGFANAITYFLGEITWNRNWQFIKKVPEWCSFEACPGETSIALMGEAGDIPTDLILWANGELSCASQMVRKWPIPVHYFDIPFNGKNRSWAIAYLRDQIQNAVDKLAKISGKPVSAADLNGGIKMVREFYDSYREYFHTVVSAESSPIRSAEDLLVKMCVFDCCGDPLALAQANRALNRELKARVVRQDESQPVQEAPLRIYMCQRGLPVHGVEFLESLGAMVMGSETLDTCCVFDDYIDSDSDDPCHALAEWTLNRQPWSMGRPLEEREEWLFSVLRKCRPDGVVFTSAWGCQLDTQFNRYLADSIRRNLNIPILMLDKEFASVEVNQENKLCLTAALQTRLEGFVEALKAIRRRRNQEIPV